MICLDLDTGLGPEEGEIGLEERGLVLHEDKRKKKVVDLHGNNLDSDDVVTDTSTQVSPLRIQEEVVPNFISASLASQDGQKP